MIVHSATGLIVRFILGAVLDAYERGTMTPELQVLVNELLSWCSAPGDETKACVSSYEWAEWWHDDEETLPDLDGEAPW